MTKLILTGLCVLCYIASTMAQTNYSSPVYPTTPTTNQVVKVESNNQDLKLYPKAELQRRLAYFSQTSWEQLQTQARNQNKPYFVAFETPWCRVCKKMDHEVYARDRVSNYARSHFLAYKLDGEVRPDVAQRYGINSYPTLIVFDSTGKELKRIQGATTERQFVELMKQHTSKIPHTKYSFFR